VNILVTGGAGYIGSHICKALSMSNFMPVTLDNLSRGVKANVKWGPLVECDILDTNGLIETINYYRPTAVIHLAGYAYVAESICKPSTYYRVNIGGTLSLVDAMTTCNVESLIFSSSCTVYGNVTTLPVKESHECHPISPYGKSKLYVEHLVESVAKTSGLKYCGLRYFNAAGADVDGEIGECHDPEPHVIPNIINAALGNKDYFVINGTDYPTEDGTCVRDFIHVSDLAQAHVVSLESLISGGDTGIFNVGSQQGFSILTLIKQVELVSGRKVPLHLGDRRAGDPAALVASADLFFNRFGWRPKYSDLSTIISTAYKWHLGCQT
jgi:UDP-arabinose 4-epimerase